MNIFDKMNEIYLPDESLEYYLCDTNYCCVCFSNEYCIKNKILETDLSLSDIEQNFFKNNIIPDNLLVKSCCGEHYICIGCMRKIINNYENHPINENSSHLSCPYPFKECVTDIGFKTVFDHNLIKKICNEEEWLNYITQAERFSFPGFTLIKCPVVGYRGMCNTNILLENELIKTTPIGELIVDCTQNSYCLKRFCFNCKQHVNYYQDMCNECKTTHENENPNVFNYFFNKNYNDILADINTNTNDIDINIDSDTDTSESKLDYEESSYLYLNKEITQEIAINQITSAIINVDSYMICSICKISLYKTEKCNGLSHHNLERCYSCGRIGFLIRGLGNHWNNNGVSGCLRFDHDNYVKTNIPEYICNDSVCYNHEKGDCTIDDHQSGIKLLQLLRKKSYVYHMIKSLLPEIRFLVYDKLYEIFYSKPELLQFLPYKQTLILLLLYKNRNIDYIEDVVYKELGCKHPNQIPEYIYKNYWIPSEQYTELYSNYQNDNRLSYLVESYNYLVTTDDDTLSIDSESGLLHTTQQEQNNTYLQDITTNITTNILDEIINELNRNINDNTYTNITNNVTIPEATISEINSQVISRFIYTYDNDNYNDNYNDNSDTINEIMTNEIMTNEITTNSITINPIINRYDLPTLTLNSYSLLINIESDIESDIESEI